MSRVRSVLDRFDQYSLGNLLADAQPGIAYLANEIGLATDDPDALLLSQSQFTQSRPHLRRGQQLPDANLRTFGHPAQRTDTRLRTGAVQKLAWFLRLAHGPAN